MELVLSEEQFNNLDGAVLEVWYNEFAKAHVLSLMAEKSKAITSIWIEEDLRNKLVKSLGA
ncbi:hypothetical protein F1F76_08595 [Listeria monocytogenes]|uniref:hypothetical protein n=1 Tax=Listeria immobilis TaxID=2713502 RepID=UPI0010B02C8C|nr:hypothetical protein [Listeria immobilis]EAC2891919.1 hypothetical protein [Listeria monocytogenes]EAF4132456.1 hypothetical protein [Listeria monocytogenes]EAF4935370.1 hypothetical protein [Listeria monocytogenes]ECR2392756.1 hypothetical protein [Listeria monocytogenes]ECR2512824.1 hypothetical protein [Listeria monocytogenes]